MLTILPLLLQVVPATATPPPAASAEVVVLGRRLEEALAACRRGGCSVKRDAEVSIAAAEQSFRAGRYEDAMRVLDAALKRNRAHAATDPLPVAALYEAYGTVTMHFGDMARYRTATTGQVRTLRENLPADDMRVVSADFALADMSTQTGRIEQADRTLEAMRDRAQAAGQTRLARIAALRRAALAVQRGDETRARPLLREIERDGGVDPELANATRVVRLRLAARHTDDAQIDALVAQVAQGRGAGARQTIVWSPAYPVSAEAAAQEGRDRFSLVDAARTEAGTQVTVQWIDVGFWVRPDGRTAEAEVLRGSRRRDWVKPMLAQIAGRRYTPAAADPGAPGDYHVERFTWRPVYGYATGSATYRRLGPPTLEITDQTQPSATVTTAR